jgi:hypothetical protein
MRAVAFAGRIRYWNPEKAGGLAVADVPADHIAALGGLRQRRVHGRIAGDEFQPSIMPAGDGRLALSVSKAMMRAAGVDIGDEVEFGIAAAD